ncbi:MAG: hypothetical protein NZ699_04415 [Roseiflexus sp.]|nr:hypothetical protein [Roseiflexus sp.]MCS7288357.1 hypothetical protein [Roseiflexus sp.]MDW8146507.1 hypothetical protein [Roseiflexaceae bacterium]MDW8231214.1 hypothetical protein [Roseiflexaceae bacterium]
MTRIEEKVRRGFELVRRAGDDSDLLGAALLAFHSALSDYLDAELRRSPSLSDAERKAIDEGTITWATRAMLAQRAGLLTEKQRERVLEINRVRTGFAHGEGFTGTARSVAAYGEFVAELCGLTSSGVERDTAARRAPTGAHHAAVGPTTTTATRPSAATVSGLRARAAERKARRAELIPESGSFRIALAAVALLFLITLAVISMRQLTPAPPSIASAPPTRLSASIALPPTNTPAPQKARIVNLPPGGPGWLRTMPSFRAPTQPIPLSEGLEVTLLDRDPVDAEGTRWRFVSVGGYDGWCPEHNLALGNG